MAAESTLDRRGARAAAADRASMQNDVRERGRPGPTPPQRRGGGKRRGDVHLGRSLQQLMDLLPYPIFVKDRFGVYTYCNAAFGEAVGRPPEEVHGLTIFDLLSREKAQIHLQVEDQLRKGVGMQVFEVPLALPEGGLRMWRLHKVSVRGRANEPAGFAGLMTPSRELAPKAGTRKSRRAELTEVETMLTVVAHELHSPLASIRASAELLNHRKLPADQRRHLVHLIHQQAYRMGEVLSDLVDVTRLHLGSADWHWQWVELGKVLEPCLESAKAALQGGGKVHLHVHSPETPIWIEGDAAALRRLVNALVSNAIRYTGSGEIELGWGAGPEPAGDNCWITVRDSGPGLPSWILERLERPFSLSSGLLGARQADGTGLGLTLAKGIIEAHQGRWEIQSAPGAGTRFRILLPRRYRRVLRADPGT